jgi:hypothetical protein
VERIVDELWILFSIAFLVASIVVGDNNFYLWAGIWFICGLLTYALLPRAIFEHLSPNLRARIPLGRFEASASPIRSYRELWRTLRSGRHRADTR